jgi:hypothetical protein
MNLVSGNPPCRGSQPISIAELTSTPKCSRFPLLSNFSITEGNTIELFPNLDSYQFSQGNTDRNAALDTFIHFGSDLIVVAQNVNVIGADVFTFVPISPTP